MSEKKSGQQKTKGMDKHQRERGYGLRHLDDNMTKRVIRVYKRVHYFEMRRQKRLGELVGDLPFHVADEHAATEAKRCASAHGVVVEARLQRWLKS